MAHASRPSQSRLTLAAHELRTPLSVTVGYLRLLRRQASTTLPADLVHLLDESERGCDRLAGLITDMSRLGQLEAGTLAWPAADVDAREVLRAAASAYAAEGTVLHVGDDGASIVRTDPDRLHEAFESIARVTARRLGERPLAVVHRHAGRKTTIVIANADLVPALLGAHPPAGPFDETPGGFGLALPVARCIVEASGGSIHSPCVEGSALPGALVRWPARPSPQPSHKRVAR